MIQVFNKYGQLEIEFTGGGGGGVQYTSGETTPTNPIGTMPVFNDGGVIKSVSDTTPLPVAATLSIPNPLPVTVDNFPSTQPISGNVTVDNFPATQPVSIAVMPTTPVTGTFFQATQPVSIATMPTTPVTGTFFQATQPVSIAATIAVKEVRSTTPSQSSVSVTNSNTSILASNSNRLGATFYNEGAAICYLKLGSTASITSYTIQIQVGGYYEIPFGYTGAIFGITSAGTATLRVTEIS